MIDSSKGLAGLRELLTEEGIQVVGLHVAELTVRRQAGKDPQAFQRGSSSRLGTILSSSWLLLGYSRIGACCRLVLGDFSGSGDGCVNGLRKSSLVAI